MQCNCCAKKKEVESIFAGVKPVVCLVPKAVPKCKGEKSKTPEPSTADVDEGAIPILDEEFIKKHFKVPERALYLDSFRRPLITFPMTQENRQSHFTMYRKSKINQQILDGYLDPSEAIKAESIFPYTGTATSGKKEKGDENEEEEETIYLLRLPDLVQHCPIHNITTKTPRYLWHSTKKDSKTEKTELKKGGGPLHRPKPWILSRITDFDLLSQW